MGSPFTPSRPDVPHVAPQWLAEALADPDARGGEITYRAACAVFDLVRRYDSTGQSGWSPMIDSIGSPTERYED